MPIHDKINAIERSPEDYPSLIAQAKNALGALGRAVASGFAQVDETEQARRLAICRACEHFDSKPERCRKCGCYAAWKVKLATQHCPDDPPRW